MIKLSLRWRNFSRKRKVELEQCGVSGELAQALAIAEARGRQRVSRIVGSTAAERAIVVFNEASGTYRLVGDIADLACRPDTPFWGYAAKL